MSFSSRLQQRSFDYGLLIALTFIAHGLLLLNDGVYWDDWYLHTALAQRNWPAIHLLAGRGIPTDPYLYWVIGNGGRIFAFKLVRFITFAAVAILIYECCIQSRRISRGQALAIAALSLAFPGDETAVVLMTTDYAVYYMSFWIAVLLAFLSEFSTSFVTQRVLFAASLLFFLLSFNLNSLLVFHFGFMIALLTSRAPFHFRKRDGVLACLPFLFWAARLVFFAPQGYFSSYNRLNLAPASLFRQMLRFAYFAGLVQMNDMLRHFFQVPVLILGASIVSVGLYAILRMAQRPFGSPGERGEKRLLFAFFLIVLATFPYAAVGKAPAIAHGPNTRCELLLAFPVACFVVWTIALLFRTQKAISRTAFLTLVLVLGAFTVQTIRTYIAWQAEWARHRALISSLARHPEGRLYATLWIRANDFRNDDYFVTGSDAFLLAAWGRDSGVRIDPRWDPTDPRLQHPDELQSDRIIVVPDEVPTRVMEPEGTLELCTSHEMGDSVIAATYLRDRIFRPERLPALFAKLADVRFRRGAPVHQDGCSCCQ